MEKFVVTIKTILRKTFVKGLFFPQKVLNHAASTKKNKYTFYETVSGDGKTIILTTDPCNFDRVAESLLDVLDPQNAKQHDVSLYFDKGVGVPYRTVTGFFMYNGELFYRVSNGGAKTVYSNTSFSEYAKICNPDEILSTREIGNIIVTPLIPVR